MRLSRRASAAAAAAARPPPTPTGPFCAHCERSVAADPAHIRCAAKVCFDLVLCIYCFSVGAADEAPHEPNHPYRIVERVSEPLYVQDWSADEEVRLLHALLDNGPNHWKSVADYVKSKSARKCESHYYDVFLNAPTAPLPDETALERDEELVDAASPAPNASMKAPADTTHSGKSGKSGRKPGKRSRARKAGKDDEVSIADPPSPDNDDEGDEGRTVPSAAAGHSGALEGFMPLRGDFDVEWDDEAEELIADLVVSSDDTEEEVALKAQLCEMYDKRLQRREAVKQFLFDRDMLNFESLKFSDRRGARDEKELAARLQVFSRLLPKDKFEAFYKSILTEHSIAKQTNQIARSREAGMRALSELEVYEIERKVRITALQERTKLDVRDSGRRRSSVAGTPSKANDLQEDATPSPAPNASLPVHLGAGSELLYIPPHVTATPESLGDIQTAPDDASGAPSVTMEPEQEGTPAESKSTMQRRAREHKRIMRSPYPQLSAMPIRGMEDESQLTFTEKKFCSALNITPREFLQQRDAMLFGACQAEHFPSPPDQDTNSVTNSVLTLRATKPHPVQPMDVSERETYLDVVQRPITRSVAAGKRNGKHRQEVVRQASHLVKLVPISAGNGTHGETPDPALTGQTRVKLERLQPEGGDIEEREEMKALQPKELQLVKENMSPRDEQNEEKERLQGQATSQKESAGTGNIDIKEKSIYIGANEQSGVGTETCSGQNTGTDPSVIHVPAQSPKLPETPNAAQDPTKEPQDINHTLQRKEGDALSVHEPTANEKAAAERALGNTESTNIEASIALCVDINKMPKQVDHEPDKVVEVASVDSKNDVGTSIKPAITRENSVEIVHVQSITKPDSVGTNDAGLAKPKPKPRRGRKKGSKISKPPREPVRRSRRNIGRTIEEAVEGLENPPSSIDDKTSGEVVIEEVLDEGDGGSLAAELAEERSEDDDDLYIPQKIENDDKPQRICHSPNNRICETEIAFEPESPEGDDTDRDTEDYVPSPEREDENMDGPSSQRKEAEAAPVRKSARIMRRRSAPKRSETQPRKRSNALRSRRALSMLDPPDWDDESSGSNANNQHPSSIPGPRKRSQAEVISHGQQTSPKYKLRRRR